MSMEPLAMRSFGKSKYGFFLACLHTVLIFQLHKQDADLAERGRHLAKLPCADGAAFNSRIWEHEPQCLPETRVDLLEQIMMWNTNPNSACIFWLNGMVGTGKSTIARTVARKLNEEECLGAS